VNEDLEKGMNMDEGLVRRFGGTFSASESEGTPSKDRGIGLGDAVSLLDFCNALRLDMTRMPEVKKSE
jgi:hypothetical protein